MLSMQSGRLRRLNAVEICVLQAEREAPLISFHNVGAVELRKDLRGASSS